MHTIYSQMYQEFSRYVLLRTKCFHLRQNYSRIRRYHSPKAGRKQGWECRRRGLEGRTRSLRESPSSRVHFRCATRISSGSSSSLDARIDSLMRNRFAAATRGSDHDPHVAMQPRQRRRGWGACPKEHSPGQGEEIREATHTGKISAMKPPARMKSGCRRGR